MVVEGFLDELMLKKTTKKFHHEIELDILMKEIISRFVKVINSHYTF